MKKNSVFAVSAITVAFLLLGAIAAYITIDYFQSRIASETVNLETEFRFLMEEDVLRMDAAKTQSSPKENDTASSGKAGTKSNTETKALTLKAVEPAETEKISEKDGKKAPAAASAETLPDASTSVKKDGKTDMKSASAQTGVTAADGQVIPASEPEKTAEHQIIWVGDSRTVSLGKTVKDDCVFIGADGEGYDWQVKTGDALLRKAIKDHPEAQVVFGFGVNDYDNMNLYLDYYKKLIQEFPDTDFWFLSINPIDPARCEVITNMEIADFNAHLKEAFPDRYLNTFTWLMVNEAITVDGIHYDEPTNQALHDVVVQAINGTTILYG